MTDCDPIFDPLCEAPQEATPSEAPQEATPSKADDAGGSKEVNLIYEIEPAMAQLTFLCVSTILITKSGLEIFKSYQTPSYDTGAIWSIANSVEDFWFFFFGAFALISQLLSLLGLAIGVNLAIWIWVIGVLGFVVTLLSNIARFDTLAVAFKWNYPDKDQIFREALERLLYMVAVYSALIWQSKSWLETQWKHLDEEPRGKLAAWLNLKEESDDDDDQDGVEAEAEAEAENAIAVATIDQVENAIAGAKIDQVENAIAGAKNLMLTAVVGMLMTTGVLDPISWIEFLLSLEQNNSLG